MSNGLTIHSLLVHAKNNKSRFATTFFSNTYAHILKQDLSMAHGMLNGMVKLPEPAPELETKYLWPLRNRDHTTTKRKNRITMKIKIIAGLMAFTAMTFSAKAINLELALVIDGSGSISPSNFALQKQGYVQGLAIIPTDGTVAIGVWQFASTVQQVFTTTVISNAGSLASLIAAVNGMVQLGGQTAIGDGIAAASLQLTTNAIASDRQLIDVSTDGFQTPGLGVDAIVARNNALAAGIDQINGLGIGAGANLGFVGGVGSFGIQVDSFNDFAPAIEQKLRREVTGGVPDAGGTFALMSLALLGVMGVRRSMRLA